MIDTHCHFDMMTSPISFIKDCEGRGDVVIGMTNLPSHFLQGFNHVKDFKHIRLALGLHPLLMAENEHEIPLFIKNVDKTSYIGEIGLDFSKEGVLSKDEQIRGLKIILSALKGKKKLISVHSRNAEKELFSLLEEYSIENVIFHWYTGNKSLIPEIIAKGYYFSVNEAMTATSSGRSIIGSIPKDRILTESDAPFNRKSDLVSAYKYLNSIGITGQDIMNNFKNLILKLY